MSFYDLTKDFVLSAKDLFKYRGKRDSTLPSKGGQKDFEPDDSWLQNKALEAFLQERTSVLAEPRVEKLKSLVQGIWDDERGLVNLKKPGKFWAHMGFTDKRRNWLYPEEALFLMECNTLEVYHGGVPFSIQEAYNMFLGSDVSIEEYQVFSHLRRLGFVVLRHENQPLITPYERQINLDKYISKKSPKNKVARFPKKDKNLKQSIKSNGTKHSTHNSVETSVLILESDESCVQTSESGDKSNVCSVSDSSSQLNQQESLLFQSEGKIIPVENDKTSPELDSLSSSFGSSNENCALSSQTDKTPNSLEAKSKKRPASTDVDSVCESAKRSCLQERTFESNSSEMSSENVTEVQVSASSSLNHNSETNLFRNFYENSWDSCFINKMKVQSSPNLDDTVCESVACTDSSMGRLTNDTHNDVRHTGLPVLLPNMANTDSVILEPPSSSLLPDNVDIEQDPELLHYDVAKYNFLNPLKELNRKELREEERAKRIQGLHFSFPEWILKNPKLEASSWKEYKQKLKDRMTEMSKSTPVDHLWKGKVTPLIRPDENRSYQSILDQLSIIKSADNETLLPDSDCVVDVKVTYDVHLPDGKFKKSMPGVPNHRVCVTKCLSDIPGLAEIHQVWSRFKDDVPLHWAVVDSGEIAFYVFDSTRISQAFL